MEQALIIAIEHYEDTASGFTEKTLARTIESATGFRDWLSAKWQTEGVDGKILFCSEPRQDGHRGAKSQDIIDALIELEDGLNQTENLYVYFSGHGFRVAGETVHRADVLVTADFKDVRHSVASCFKLNAIIDGLRTSLGPGNHFYFIDACRNEIEKAIASNVMVFGQKGEEDPSVFVLQSTTPGAPALVGGPFAEKLLAGLRGSGKAKVWEPPDTESMKVRFDSLQRFLKGTLGSAQQITGSSEGQRDAGEVVLATIKPVPMVQCTVRVNTTRQTLNGSIHVLPYNSTAGTTHPVTGPVTTLQLPPNHYKLMLSLNGLSVDPAGAVPVELYEDREVPFKVVTRVLSFGLESMSSRPSREPNVRVEVPVNGTIVLVDQGTGKEWQFSESTSARLPAGSFFTRLLAPSGEMLRASVYEVKAGVDTVIALPGWKAVSAAHETIVKFAAADLESDADLEEGIRSVLLDGDLSVSLAMVGAGRILGGEGDYRKFRAFPLQNFSNLQAGASPVYLLAALPDSATQLRVKIHGADGRGEWKESKQPVGMEGIRERVAQRDPGQCFVTVAIGDQPTCTVTSFAMPNRCTLVVLTLGENGEPKFGQYLLPIAHLVEHLAADVRQRLTQRDQLKDVHLLALLSRAFRKRRKLENEFGNHELEALLYAKWLDPIGGALATYECIRRNQRGALNVVAHNMDTYFHDLPDTGAIQTIVRGHGDSWRGVPLFLDGLRAFPNFQEVLPFPAGLLDFSGPWTAWRGAVNE